MISHISMNIIMAYDLDAVVEFYRMLGLTLNFHMKGQWAEFVVGNMKLGICPMSEQPTHDVRTGIVFQVNDLIKMYNEMGDTINFVVAPLEKVHGIMASVKDPAGNIIDLYQPTPEKVADVVAQAKKEDGCGKKDDECCAGSA